MSVSVIAEQGSEVVCEMWLIKFPSRETRMLGNTHMIPEAMLKRSVVSS
jgi:hypothetical protein